MAKDETRVVGLGNALVDVVASVEAATVARHDLKPGGMHLVDRDAAEALYAEVGPGLVQSGGSVANSIAHMRGGGLPCTFIGKIAEDELGQAFRADLAALGVYFPALTPAGKDGTGRCVVLVTPDGERTMSTYLGAAQGPGRRGGRDAEARRAVAGRGLSLGFARGRGGDPRRRGPGARRRGADRADAVGCRLRRAQPRRHAGLHPRPLRHPGGQP